MRLNLDCIRDLIIEIDNNLKLDEHGNITPIDVDKLSNSENLSIYDHSEIIYYVKGLYESDILKPDECYVSDTCSRIADITPQGYNFLDSIKPISKWDVFKSKFTSYGIPTLTFLMQNAQTIAELSK